MKVDIPLNEEIKAKIYLYKIYYQELINLYDAHLDLCIECES